MARKGVTTISNKAVIAGWTVNKLLEGAGAGADPIEIDAVGNTEAIIVSDTLRNSNDTERTTAAVAYTNVKEVKLNAALSGCRIKFDLKGMTNWGYARIYKNGVAIGTERQDNAEVYATFSEDFAGFVADDLIQIYAYNSGGGTTYVRNMRFYYDGRITHLHGTELTSALSKVISAISMTNQDP